MTEKAKLKRELLIKIHNEKFARTTQKERDEAAARVESYFAGTLPENPSKFTEKELMHFQQCQKDTNAS